MTCFVQWDVSRFDASALLYFLWELFPYSCYPSSGSLKEYIWHISLPSDPIFKQSHTARRSLHQLIPGLSVDAWGNKWLWFQAAEFWSVCYHCNSCLILCVSQDLFVLPWSMSCMWPNLDKSYLFPQITNHWWIAVRCSPLFVSSWYRDYLNLPNFFFPFLAGSADFPHALPILCILLIGVSQYHSLILYLTFIP